MFNANKIFRNLFKNTSQRELDSIKSIIEKIGALEPDFNKISNEAFSKKTSEFKTKIKNGIKLDSLVPESFAYVREAASRAERDGK